MDLRARPGGPGTADGGDALEDLSAREQPFSATSVIGSLARLFGAVAVGMSLYEILKQTAFPHITIWVSHAVTVAVSSCAATIAGYLVMRVMWRTRVEELRAKDERFQLVSRATNDSVWDWDLATNAIWWSESEYKNFGFDREDIRPTAAWWQEHIHPEDRERVREGAWAAIEGGKANWSAEYRYRRADGSYAHVLDQGYVMRGPEGRAIRMVGVKTDISERKRAEQELIDAKELAESANRSKSEFLANMSHEIRTPMNGVIGMTDLVLDTELTAEQREYLRIVKSSADALLTVINDILDVSRMEAGKCDLDPIDFIVRDAIGDMADALALRAHQKGLELIVDVDATVPTTVRGDPGRLRQILVNLIGNAIKFTQRGEVVVRVTIETATPADIMLHFAVTDTGVGIPLDRQTCIFEAFTQADGSTTRTYGGTGLGLTIASQLVALMHGRLSVTSEAGRGSTFQFTATFGAVRVPVVAAAPDAVDLRGLPALIVDDNATNRRLLDVMLRGWALVPTQASSASEALTALRAARLSGKPFPLVLADVHMPEADGFSLAEAIRNEVGIAHASVVMLTSGGQPGDAARCRELGVAAYLTKPIRSKDLRSAMVLALSHDSTERDRPALVTRHSLRETRHTGRILLVEDNRVNRLVASRLLERRGYTVVQVTNGREALAILNDGTTVGFGCVLMDVQMPEMDGFECTAIIRESEQRTHEHLPIIAMTAHAMKGDEARCRAAGMDGYLSKPIQPEEFFDVIERQLGVTRETELTG